MPRQQRAFRSAVETRGELVEPLRPPAGLLVVAVVDSLVIFKVQAV